MVIHGLQKLTLLDYPGHTACTVFTAHCPWRCPFCHNASLVLEPESQPVIPEEEIFSFLAHRKGLLDGVAVTGGEPTLQRDLPEFLRKIKALGFAVKLDTNGTNPAMLRAILSEKLADYVAMDIKAGRENYSAVTGTLRPGLAAVEECARMLMDGDTDFEFRTTVVRGLHSAEDFADIAAEREVFPSGIQGFRRRDLRRLRRLHARGDGVVPGDTAARHSERRDPRHGLIPVSAIYAAAPPFSGRRHYI